MKTWVLCISILCTGTVGFVAWRVHALQERVTPYFEIVEDSSASHWNGCDSLLGIAEQVLKSDHRAPGSTLTVLALGDYSTVNEPRRMGEYALPTIRKVLEGKRTKLKQEEKILNDISAKCQSLSPTNVSPIFGGIAVATADLHAHGCKDASHCELFVDSDLEENVEAPIRRSLNGPGGGTHVPLPQLDNQGIDVVFCGLVVSVGRAVDSSGREVYKASPHNARRKDQLRQTWLSLFTRPQAVRFEPYCPQSVASN